MVFWFQHIFLPQQKTSTNSSDSKFSILNSQESFALIAATSEELEAKWKLLRLQCNYIQPRILVIGETSNKKSIIVNFIYSVKSIISRKLLSILCSMFVNQKI